MVSFDWQSTQNEILLNSKFSAETKRLFLKRLESLDREFQGHFFLLTSGTTFSSGFDQKWVALSKAAVLSSARAVNQHLESDAQDVWIHALPDFHVGGMGVWARSYLSGAKVISLQGWNVKDWLSAIVHFQGTLSSLVPTQVYDLVQSQQSCPPSVRAILVGGGALSMNLCQKARELGWPVIPTYGMTEAASQIATASLWRQGDELLSHTDLRVLPHLEVRQGENDVLEFRGSSLLTAYLFYRELDGGQDSDVHTAWPSAQEGRRVGEFWVVDPKKDGWFCSEDRGQVREGILTPWGRVGDFVKVGGEGVQFSDLNLLLEEIKLKLGIQSDAALYPCSDPRLGQSVGLVFDRHMSDGQRDSLIQAFNERVLGFARIRSVLRMEALPRTPLGKLMVHQIPKRNC